MDIKTKIESMVLIADAKTLGFSIKVPQELKSAKILQTTLDRYCPPLEDRVLHFSWAYAYRRWRDQAPENQETSIEDFQSLCMVPERLYLYTDAWAEIAEKLPKKIQLEYVKLALG